MFCFLDHTPPVDLFVVFCFLCDYGGLPPLPSPCPMPGGAPVEKLKKLSRITDPADEMLSTLMSVLGGMPTGAADCSEMFHTSGRYDVPATSGCPP